LGAPAPESKVEAPLPVLDPASRAVALKFLKRGDEELAEGRVAPARLLYERAAEMGLAQAAMALAGTYDAAELAKPHLLNVVPDPVQAKRWYERAKMLGAAEAAARLQRLGSTGK
jgi:TPR repeat protein